MVSVIEDVARLIQKEAKRMTTQTDIETKKEILKTKRECRDEYNEKLANAIREYKLQHNKNISDDIEHQKGQISSLKKEHKAAIIKIQRENHDYVCSITEKVSNLYGVPMKKVRRDLAPNNDIYCMGIKKNGKLCTNKAVVDGYCCLHVDENRPGTPVVVPTGVIRHNHPFPSGFVHGCLACEEGKLQPNEFRDYVL